MIIEKNKRKKILKVIQTSNRVVEYLSNKQFSPLILGFFASATVVANE